MQRKIRPVTQLESRFLFSKQHSLESQWVLEGSVISRQVLEGSRCITLTCEPLPSCVFRASLLTFGRLKSICSQASFVENFKNLEKIIYFQK